MSDARNAHNIRTVETVGIVGLGYVGLPLAATFAEAGLSVVGVDNSASKVEALNAGESYVQDVSSAMLLDLVSSRKARFSQEYEPLQEAEAVLICLPTPLDEYREPDLSIVVAGVEEISANLRPGALVVLESTTYPGTTREVVQPILEQNGRREIGDDFHLAFSPERVDPGNIGYNIKSTPKVVGGVTEGCAALAEELYARVVNEVHVVSSPESAEMSKLLENVFRGVNIALVNELAILCHRMGIDVWEVVDAAKTKPFGFMPFYPGPGLGGHCIPVDPFYLSWRARAFDMSTEFIELAGRTNVNMPYYAESRVTSALNAEKKPVNGSRILMLGVSYKPNVGDLRESPSLKILELLARDGADVAYHDPYVPELPDNGLESVELTEGQIEEADCVVIATDHKVVDLEPVVARASKIVDLRNAVRNRLGAHSLEDLENVEIL
ncbi:nucleotide sugar dehydrogenase [Rubrobacter aplysinae]|uniref:nucleotide sugar dehydrogenase n=1 Tax=Rubrobacter aplysinae TaxID=909625 RepID=UPI00064BFB5A|nr:nucleotide sugar dehydrogenase [Rubrobacter aplysinae]